MTIVDSPINFPVGLTENYLLNAKLLCPIPDQAFKVTNKMLYPTVPYMFGGNHAILAHYE